MHGKREETFLENQRSKHGLGGFIDWRRRERQLSRDELARRVRCTAKTVAAWEKGASVPQPRNAAALARALRVSRTMLVSDEAWQQVRAGEEEPDHWFMPTHTYPDADHASFKEALIRTFTDDRLFSDESAVEVDVIGFDGENLGRLVKNCYKNVDKALRREGRKREVDVRVFLVDSHAARGRFNNLIRPVAPVALKNNWHVNVNVVAKPMHMPSVHGTRIRKGHAVMQVYLGLTKFGEDFVPTSAGSPYLHFDFEDENADEYVWNFVGELFENCWAMLEASDEKTSFSWPPPPS